MWTNTLDGRGGDEKKVDKSAKPENDEDHECKRLSWTGLNGIFVEGKKHSISVPDLGSSRDFDGVIFHRLHLRALVPDNLELIVIRTSPD